MNKYDELKTMGFRFDHSATERGYISRKIVCKIVPYIGRFGIGVKVIFPRTDTTQYVDIEYHILDSGEIHARNLMGNIIRISYDTFKNGRHCYKLYHNEYRRDLSKDLYDIKLKEWDYLCN